MNKILSLFDKTYVADFFNQKILPLYPEFKKIKQIKITPIKKNVWPATYHVVIRFSTSFLTKSGNLVNLPIYLTAHSDEPRESSFQALKFLWQADFNQGDLVIPRPLLFSTDFNGYFYRGVEGRTLYNYLRDKNHKNIEAIVIKTAAWFAKLHNTPTEGANNFNPLNSRVETVIPGVSKVLQKINKFYPKYFESYKKIYEIIIQQEKKYFASLGQAYLIHGDAHPKNIIKMSENKIAVIDFTDMCLADFARDLGSFLQQLEFMSTEKNLAPFYVEKIKNLFLDNYKLGAKTKIDDYAEERIDNYYNWTALRTASYFMLKDKPEPARSYGLLIKIRQKLKIKAKV